MMIDLTGRSALVTGATGGIGEAIARRLHGLGATVGIHGTRIEKIESLVSEFGERAVPLQADLSDPSAVEYLGKEAEGQLEGIDILVNNAGITADGLMMRMKQEDWDRVLAVNLTAVFHLTKLIIGPMMKRRNGRIINISSVVGATGNPGQVNYVTSKAGLIGFTKSLAQEMASRSITVNAIAPGFISSAMTDKLNEKQRDSILGTIPMKRLGTGDEVSAAAAFLASDEAAYVTGQTIHVNGGMAMF